MRLKIFTLCGIVLAMSLLTGCKKGVRIELPVVRYVVFTDASYQWVAVIAMVKHLPTNPPGATLKIRNDLDRSLTLDFDGPSHYSISINDHSDTTLEIQEGSYKIMASAPGLAYIPSDIRPFFSDRCVYQWTWFREKLTRKY
jgi:hypothetical protein